MFEDVEWASPFGYYHKDINNSKRKEPKMETPESIKSHADDYKNKAWQDYSLAELGQWVHLFCKRSQHRNDRKKEVKDLYDAQNYLNMMQEHINFLKG
jgi:hypothetical protein